MIACVAVLNFSVYSTNQLASQSVYEGFASETARTLAAATKFGYQDEFYKAVEKVKRKRSDKDLEDFNGKDEVAIVEYLISPLKKPEWRLTSDVGENVGRLSKALRAVGIKHADLGKITQSYYDNVTKSLFGDVQFVDSVPNTTFKKLDSLDYGEALKGIDKGILDNTPQLWSIYENYKESDSYFEKIVGSVSAFLAAVCASNGNKLKLDKITHGVEVYKCLLNLGYENLENSSAKDKQEMTFDKLMSLLPGFMLSVKKQKLFNKVKKGKGNDLDKQKSGRSEGVFVKGGKDAKFKFAGN